MDEKQPYRIKRQSIDTKKAIKKLKSKKVVNTDKDGTPIQLLPYESPKLPLYMMICPAGEYQSDSWLGLGWEILKHRLWHLRNDGSFMD